ncbi:MAG: ATP-dependent Zn protease [Leptolyngbya sp. BL-A-14]
MNQLSLNLVAIGIFTITMTSLLGPIINVSPVVPAIATAGVLGLATLDTLGWRGQGSTLMLDWIARFSAKHRDRVIRHEAGHFLVAHQLGIPAMGYTLNAWDALRQGYSGQGGVRFDSQELEAAIQQGQLSGQLLDRYCTIWMAGIAAEMLIYGNVEGGTDDRQKLRGLLTQLGLTPAERDQKERWSLLRAKTLLQDNVSAYEALLNAMTKDASVEECSQAIEQHLPQVA